MPHAADESACWGCELACVVLLSFPLDIKCKSVRAGVDKGDVVLTVDGDVLRIAVNQEEVGPNRTLHHFQMSCN